MLQPKSWLHQQFIYDFSKLYSMKRKTTLILVSLLLTSVVSAGLADISTTLKYDRISDKDIKRDMDIVEYQTKNIKEKQHIRKDKYL